MQWIEANLSQSISKISRIRFFLIWQQIIYTGLLNYNNSNCTTTPSWDYSFFLYAYQMTYLIQVTIPRSRKICTRRHSIFNLANVKEIFTSLSKISSSTKGVCICVSLCVNIQHQSWFTTMFNIMMARRCILIQKQQHL